MILVYISGVILAIALTGLGYAILSFKKNSKPSFEQLDSINERMQQEKDAIQIQTEKMKEKQNRLKNDMDWKKSVFQFTVGEVKNLSYTFKTSSKRKQSDYSRSI